MMRSAKTPRKLLGSPSQRIEWLFPAPARSRPQTRCLRSLAAVAKRPQPRKKTPLETPNDAKLAQTGHQIRLQHAANAELAKGAFPPDILEELLAKRTPEDLAGLDSMARSALLWETTAPPRSQIRGKLRAWEEQQRKNEDRPGPNPHSIQAQSSSQYSWLYTEDMDRLRFEDMESAPIKGELLERDDDGVLEPIGGKPELLPGDIVSLPNRSISDFDYMAVFVQQIGDQAQFYDLSGQYFIRDGNWAATIYPPVRGIVSPELAKTLIPYLPTEPVSKADEVRFGPVPRSAAKPIYDLLHGFSQEALRFYHTNRHKVDNLYTALADEKHRKYLTLDEFCTAVVGDGWDSLTMPQKFALHVSLNKSVGVKPLRLPRDAQALYVLRPASSTRRLLRVVEWARLYQEAAARSAGKTAQLDPAPDNPLYSFIDKARKIVLASRTLRKPTVTGCLGPSIEQTFSGVIEIPGERFSATDQMILEFLYTVYAEVPPTTNATFKSLGSLIVRAIGAYPRMDLGMNAGYMLLQELGILSPWSHRRLGDWSLNLANTGGDLITDQLYQECLLPEYQKSIEGLPDRMADLRKDWGDLPVFCVDSATTTEIDDGFSLEHVPGSEDLKWLHVHIADPSAFIAPTEKIAIYARRVLATSYTSEHNVKMLPGPVPSTRFSLGPNRPAMTISSLIGPDGSLRDVQIMPSIVHNVVKLTPEQLQQQLWQQEADETVYTIGQPAPTEARGKVDSWKEHVPTLLELRYLLTHSLRRKRASPGFLSPRPDSNQMGNQVSVAVQYAAYQKPDFTQSRHLKGDPTIQLRIKSPAAASGQPHRTAEQDVSQNLVAEIMQTACEAAALWCSQRNIPIIYTGTKAHVDWPVSRLRSLLETEAPFASDNATWPTAVFSSTPLIHSSIGVDQYSRVTSPLRRYTDLLAHWQINAYLREAADARSTAGADLSSSLQFSRSHLEEYLQDIIGREHKLKTLSKLDEKHWILQALFRAFYFSEPKLPETYHVRVTHVSKSPYTNVPSVVEGTIPDFRLNCTFERSGPRFEERVKVGDIISVKISKVDPCLPGAITVEAVSTPLPRNEISAEANALGQH